MFLVRIVRNLPLAKRKSVGFIWLEYFAVFTDLGSMGVLSYCEMKGNAFYCKNVFKKQNIGRKSHIFGKHFYPERVFIDAD